MSSNLIKRTILLETLTSRAPDFTYGTITGDSIYVNILITQNIEDMGMFTDVDINNGPLFTPYAVAGVPFIHNDLIVKLLEEGLSFPFMTGATTSTINTGFTKDLRVSNSSLSAYTANTGTVTGVTDSKLLSLRTYTVATPYVVGFDINKEVYVNYTGNTINGVSRVLSLSGTTGYTFDANNDIYIGTPLQKTGIYYNDLTTTRKVLFNDTNTTKVIPVTNVVFKGEGWNKSNITLSGITKEEIYLGIVSQPEIESDVFIDRGITTVLESHMRLSEIRTMEELVLYGNGFYKIITQ